MKVQGTSWILILLVLAAAGIASVSCKGSEEEDTVSSRAYKGHESDVDMNNFVNVYRSTLGTRLDDCQTCHTGGTFTDDGGDTITKNSCDYCHLIIHPDDTLVSPPQPTEYIDTLNPYGLDYSAAGRSRQALRDIEADDSDSDGFASLAEIEDLKYPGDPNSMPGQDLAPSVKLTMEDLVSMPSHTEFLLANASRQQYDFYATYAGVRIRDLLEAAGVDLGDAAIEGITVIAPDGFLKDFTVDEVQNAFPAGLYYAGLDVETLGTECGFVTYPDDLPEGLTDGGEIPGEQWLLLAYERDGLPMEPSSLDITSGKINGEGPLRVVVPQTEPGSPDRGATYSPTTCGDGFDYDDTKDHNAGDMVRGVVAIRINPLPAGTEDFDYQNGGWAFIDEESVLVYGHGISAP